ncbi:MAG: DUF4395 domain-containing protein [Acidimicrobiia bacterium]
MSQPPLDADPVVDVNVPRFNQAVIAVIIGLAFLFQSAWLVLLATGVLAVSAFTSYGPLTLLYTRLIRPRLQPGGPTEFEPAAPPRFSQRLGAGFLTAASLALLVGAPTVGWALALLVMALATLAALARICVGCIFYEKVLAR